MATINEFDQKVGFAVPNWKSAKLPTNTNLTGRYCILEPINLDKHAIQLFDSLQINNRGESWTYLPYGPFNTHEEFSHWLKATSLETDTRLYAILDAKTHQAIGISGYLRINPLHGVIEVGHLHFSKLLQKTPLATEAMYLMMKHVFNDLGYRRYEWKCNALNQASCNAAKRLGFTFEGIFRQSNVFKNLNRDTAWYSILDSEWPKLKEKFQKWLNPNNFEANGKQIVKFNEI